MKKLILPLTIILICALLLPTFTLRFAGENFEFFALSELLIIFPLTALGLGIYSGFDPAARWFLPPLFLALLLISCKLLYMMYWLDILIYLAAYFAISAGAFGVTLCLRRFKKRRRQ